jgi:acyl carrier protein
VSEEEVAALVESFVRSAFSIRRSDRRFGRTTDLFDGGYVDSIGVVELLEFLEQRFVVHIPEDDLFSPEFSTVNGIAGIIMRNRVEQQVSG